MESENMIAVLGASGLPYTPDAAGLSQLIHDFKNMHERYVRQVLENVNAELESDKNELHKWLTDQADKHAAAIWCNDPAIKEHIARLRAWADLVKGL